MLWMLVMTLTTYNQRNEYVVDQLHSAADCYAELRKVRNQTLHRVVRVEFACERTKVEKK